MSDLYSLVSSGFTSAQRDTMAWPGKPASRPAIMLAMSCSFSGDTIRDNKDSTFGSWRGYLPIAPWGTYSCRGKGLATVLWSTLDARLKLPGGAMEKQILRVMKRDILAKGNSSVATRARCRYVPPAWRSKGPTFATLDGLRVHKAHNGCIRHQAKKHPGKSPGCVNEVHSFLRCPAALGVPAAVFSPQVSAVSAAASAGPVLASPPPEQGRFAADAASEEEKPVHSGSARADNLAAPLAGGRFAPGAADWDETHLAD
jgi:hypothetical protein